MKRALGTAAILLLCGRSGAHAATAVDSHTLYFNNCQPNGCTIHVGATNALTDTSDLPSRTSTVAAFNQNATAWASVLSCARSVMSPFNVTITDQRPASGDFFELIVAGSASDIGAPSSTGAVADAPCTDIGVCNVYQPDAVVFAFANTLGSDPNQICTAALQALAQTWALDHVVDPSDVMTYNDFTGLRTFHDGEACGSDCVNDLSPSVSAPARRRRTRSRPSSRCSARRARAAPQAEAARRARMAPQAKAAPRVRAAPSGEPEAQPVPAAHRVSPARPVSAAQRETAAEVARPAPAAPPRRARAAAVAARSNRAIAHPRP